MGFAPRQAPEIVVVALYDHGGHGQFAAPIARDVIKAYFDKKARLAAQANGVAKAVSSLFRFGLPGPPPPEPSMIDAVYISSEDSEASAASQAARRHNPGPRPPAPNPVARRATRPPHNS